MARQILELRDPAPKYREGAEYTTPVDDLDLLDPTGWDHPTLYLDTEHGVPMAEFAPRLWSILATLCGGEDQVTRTTLGQQLVLNARFFEGPPPPMTSDFWVGRHWHIDVPGERTDLSGRRDGLVLLVLWSDVTPGGGGPLYSVGSLNSVIRQIELAAVDTRPREWGTQVFQMCADAAEFCGVAGDVLITHPFMLHAAQPNFSRVVRVLENPTVTVRQSLNYSHANRSPTPIESCVIRRLRAVATNGADLLGDRARRLGAEHPDYFLPAASLRLQTLAPSQLAALHELDRWLFTSWAREQAESIKSSHATWWGRLRSVAELGKRLLVTDSEVGASLSELPSDPHFADTTWSKLVRGLVTHATHNYILAAILGELAPGALELLETDSAPGHLFVRVVTPDGWAFLDSSAPEPVFVVEEVAGQRLLGAAYHPGNKQSPGDKWPPVSGLMLARRSGIELPQEPGPSPPVPPEHAESQQAAELGVWHRFLRARLQQLFGEPGAAQAEYTKLARELNRRGLTAALAGQLAARFPAEGSNQP